MCCFERKNGGKVGKLCVVVRRRRRNRRKRRRKGRNKRRRNRRNIVFLIYLFSSHFYQYFPFHVLVLEFFGISFTIEISCLTIPIFFLSVRSGNIYAYFPTLFLNPIKRFPKIFAQSSFAFHDFQVLFVIFLLTW